MAGSYIAIEKKVLTTWNLVTEICEPSFITHMKVHLPIPSGNLKYLSLNKYVPIN